MTLSEMITKLPELTTREQLLLLEALSRALRTDLESPSPAERAEREATVDRLFGALRSDSEPPTDEAVREGHTDYLSKKYA